MSFASVTSESCKEDAFQCANGNECVLKAFVCDGSPSCSDGSDEDPETCETWSYEYEDYYGEEVEEEDEGGGGGWFGGWGGGGDEDEEDTTSGTVFEDTSSESEETDQEVTDERDYSVPESVEESDESATGTQWCSKKECIPRRPVNFIDGNQYNYAYVSKSKTEAIHAGSNQTASMVIACDVSIKVMTACEMELELKNVVLKSSSPDRDEPFLMTDGDLGFLEELEKESLRFSMLDGEVDSICPSSFDENSRALNFKKGILSLFQNTMPQLDLSHHQVEKDIVGECEMDYHFEGADGLKVVVSKSKNLDSCRSRSYFSSAAQGVPYDFSPQVNPLQIVASKSECQQAIKNGIIRDVSCKETHVLTPFNIDQGGIQTTIDQKLSFVEEVFFLSSPKRPFKTRTDLLFNHQLSFQREELAKDASDKVEVVNRILNAVDDISNNQHSGPNEDKPSPSQHFEHLVRSLAEFSLDDFKMLAESRSWNVLDRRYFYDAVPMAGTSTAIQFIAEELPKQLVSNPSTASSWITTLAFIQKPEIDHILAISKLLEIEDAPLEVFLSAGSLLNSYCLSHPSCELHEPVKRAIGIFLQALSSSCETENYNKKLKTIMALRGLGNAGLAADGTISASINSCILNKQAEAEVRTTAIEAFRRIPCNVSRGAFFETLRDQSEDAEVRIMAYLGLMRCPNYQIVQLIDELFKEEEVNQVGSFIWTHLTNLQETNIPSKIEIQSLLSNRKYEEKFKSDFRKYSKNIELSAFYDAMNIGGSLESNIIFSQKSFIPRQTTLNLTADLFGRSFNFFEAGIRLQGFEKSIENLIRGGVKDVDPSSIRSRDVQHKITEAQAAVHHETEPEVSFHMSTFGNDFTYQHLNNIEQIAEKFKSFNIHNIMKKLQEGKEFTFEKSMIPLDSSYTLATSTGLPLRIVTKGTVATDVSASLRMDILDIFRGKGMIQGHLRPSVSANVRASMFIDGYSAKTGIELDSSLDSSTAFDGKIEIDHKNAVKIDLGLPVDKMEIFKTSSKIMLIHGHNLESVARTDDEPHNREDVYDTNIPMQASADCLSYRDMLGIKLCWSKSHSSFHPSFLNPQIVLKGPVKFSTTLTKMDPTVTTYKFRYEWANDNEKLLFHLLYDTPGSRVNRKTSIIFEVSYVMSNIRIILNTLISSIEIKGNYVFTDDIKRLNASLNFNSEHLASMDVGYKIHERRGERIVIPSFQIYWKNIRVIKIEGDLETRTRDPDKKEWDYGVNLELEIDLRGTERGSKRGRGEISGFIKRKNMDWEANLYATYSFIGSPTKENVNFYYKKVTQTSDSVMKEARSWEVSFTQFPHLNTKGEWASKRFPGSIEDSIKASLGSNYKNPLHRVDFFRNFIFYAGLDQTTFNATVAIKYPLKNLDIAIGGDLFHSNRHINAGLLFKYSTDQSIRAKFHVSRKISPEAIIEGDFLFVVPNWLNLQAKTLVKQTTANTFEFEFDGSLGQFNRLEIAGQYQDLSTKLKKLHHVEMRLKIPYHDIIFSNSTFLYDPEQIVVASQIITKDGSKYKIRLAHIIPRIGTFSAQERQIEVDLSLPGRYYYWHSSIAFGHYLTITNDIHLDSFRDISALIKIRKGERDEPTSVEAVFKWDANRDPRKIANFQMTFYERSIDLSSSISFFGNKYKGTWKSSKDWIIDDNHLKFWHHFHGGELSWFDDHRIEHKLAFGASFNLTRDQGAEFTADAYLKTPVEEWKDNSVHLQYARSATKIVAVLKSNWHRDESLSLIFNLGTQRIDDLLKGECLVEILSFINANTVTFSTGAVFTQNRTDVDGRVFLEWDEDTVELILGAKNRSGPKDIRGSVLAKLFTTLPGYKRLSGSINLYGSSTSVEIMATTKWEDNIYKLKFSGDMYTSKEYLRGEVRLTTPQFGPDTALAIIRVYHDSETHEEKLMVIGQWLNQKVTLNGRVLVEPENFWASVDLNTPFAKLHQASLSLGHSTKEFYMTQVWCKWNTTNDLGLKLISKVTSLRDFVFSASLKTPFPKYKELQAELRNLFMLTPSVQVNSRIFAQLDKKKFGLGGRYEQGKSPKLRVGLEMYYPVPGLQEVKFDIADNSSSTNMRYNFELRHGEERQIIIRTDFMRGTKSVMFSLDSTSTLASLLGPEFKKITIEGDTKISWDSGTDFDIRLAARTMTDTFKVFSKGSIMKGHSGSFEANLVLPILNWKDLAIKLEYELPGYESSGLVDMYVISSGSPIATLDLKGGLREGYLSFTAPLESPFNQGHLRFKLIPQDIVKSLAAGTISLGGSQFFFDGYVFLENNYITKAELSAMTPFEGFKNISLTIEGHQIPEGGSKTVFQLKGTSSYFEGEIFHQSESEKNWLLSVKTGLKLVGEEKKSYEGTISYEIPRGHSVDINLNLKIPEMEAFALSLQMQSEMSPYQLKIKWDIFETSGTLEVLLDNFENERIRGSAQLTLKDSIGRPGGVHKLKVDLHNRSTLDAVDLSLFIEIISTHPQWDYILVDGHLKQVTLEPGLLNVFLIWPKMNPVNFTAMARYSGEPIFDLKTQVHLNLTTVHYGFLGEVKQVLPNLIINGALWWQKEFSSEVKNIRLESNFKFIGEDIEGTMSLKLPMMKYYELTVANVSYRQIEDFKKLRVTVNAGNTRTTYTSFRKSRQFPAAQGNVTISSTLFREGHPITITFDQSLTSKGFIGEYHLEGPVLNRTSNTYDTLSIEAKLNHTNLESGQEGVLELIIPQMKGVPISIIYSFQFPSKPDVTIKLGVIYKRIKFEVKGSHVLITRSNQRIKQTSIEIDNLIWPFGIIYEETVSLKKTDEENTGGYSGDLQANDRITIYDLQNTDRRYSFSFDRKGNNEGGRISLNGLLGERQMEISAGYTSLPHHIGGDLFISRFLGERIEFQLDWVEDVETFERSNERRHSITARFAHPLRIILLNTSYGSLLDQHFVNLNFSSNHQNPDDVPLTASFIYKNPNLGLEKDMQLLMTISHPSLATDIFIRGDYKKNETHPLCTNLSLKYSPEKEKNVIITALVERDGNDGLKDLFEITHEKSSLHAKSTGNVRYEAIGYFFDQDLRYVTPDGETHAVRMDGGLNLEENLLYALIESSERIFDLNVKLEDQGQNHWVVTANSKTIDLLPVKTSFDLNPDRSVFSLTMESLKEKSREEEATVFHDVDYPRYLADRVTLDGGLEDERFVHFSIRHSSVPRDSHSSESWIQDVDFAFKLNNSKLVFSHFQWRKRMEKEIQNEISELIGVTREFRASIQEWLRNSAIILGQEVARRSRPISKELVEAIKPLIHHIKNETLTFKTEFYALMKNINMTRKEKDYLASIEYTFKNIAVSLNQMGFVTKLRAALARGTLGNQIKAFIAKVKAIMVNTFKKESSITEYIEALKSLASSFATTYDNAAKKIYLLFRDTVNDLRIQLTEWLRDKWHGLYYSYKPHIFRTVHHIELATYSIVSRLWEFMNTLGANLKSSSYMQTLKEIYRSLKYIYDEMSSRSLRQNVEWIYKYTMMHIRNGMNTFVVKILPFTKDWLEEVHRAWLKITSYEPIASAVDFCSNILQMVYWGLNKIDFSEHFIDASAFILENGYQIVSQKATTAQMNGLAAKTELVWLPHDGNIRLVQKLPFVWNTFNQKPDLTEFFEIPYISRLVFPLIFPSKKFSVLDKWYRYFNFNYEPSTWIPPFEATAYLVGDNNILTFDGRHLQYTTTCEHLLAADLKYKRWAMTIQDNKYTPKIIKIYIDGKVVEFSKSFKVKVDGSLISLPYMLKSAFIWRSDGSVHLTQRDQMEMSWNPTHDVVAIKLPRDAFLSTAGILGTNNNEPSDDLLMADGTQYRGEDHFRFFQSWRVNNKCPSDTFITTLIDPETSPLCKELFLSKASPFRYCFYQTDPEPYYEMCLNTYKGKFRDTSGVALAYRERCRENAVPIKLPAYYVSCSYTDYQRNTKIIEEGQAVVLQQSQVPNIVDVVVLVELQGCNKEKIRAKSFHSFLTLFSDGMKKEGVASARFALVAYGGAGNNWEPHIVSSDSEVFSSGRSIAKLTENLNFHSNDFQTESEGSVTFKAITFASNLPFRATGSLTLLLFSCSPCPEAYGLDYSTMYHILLNNAATLFVFKDDYFDIAKSSVKNKIVGFDQEKALVLKDHKKKKMGDLALKKQIRLPKSELNLCLPLALETKGAVFSSAFLASSKKRSERMALVAGRRAGQSTAKNYDQRCLCLSTQDVTPLLRCDPWDNGDFTVLERYGLDIGDDQFLRSDVPEEKKEGFYRRE